MRDGERLHILMMSLCGMLWLWGAACGANKDLPATSEGNPDAAADRGGGGAIGTGGTGTGGAAGRAGSGGSSSRFSSDAGLVPDAGMPADAPAVLKPDAGSNPDRFSQPDTGPKLDLAPHPDAGNKADASNSYDAGATPDASPGHDAVSRDDSMTSPESGPILYGLNVGTYCYTITSVAPGYNDGCDFGVASMQGTVLPADYDDGRGVMTLGHDGSLGSGLVSDNVGTLVRPKSKVNELTLSQCSWNEAVTTTLTMTDTNKFVVSVVDEEDSIARPAARLSARAGRPGRGPWSSTPPSPHQAA